MARWQLLKALPVAAYHQVRLLLSFAEGWLLALIVGSATAAIVAALLFLQHTTIPLIVADVVISYGVIGGGLLWLLRGKADEAENTPLRRRRRELAIKENLDAHSRLFEVLAEARDELRRSKVVQAELLAAGKNQKVAVTRVQPVYAGPRCHLCGSAMVTSVISSGNASGIAMGLIVFLVGFIVMCIPIIGWVIGPCLIICSLFMGGRRQRVLRCTCCNAVAPTV